MTGFESSVLTRRPFAIVPVTDNNPLDALGLVITRNIGNSAPLAVCEILDLVRLAVGGIGGTNKHVVGDVVQMATVLQPRASHRDVIGGRLALSLDENRDVGGILTVPRFKWLKNLESVRGGRHGDLNGGAVLWWGLISVASWVIALGRKTNAAGFLELEFLAIGIL